jgi:sigma-E factor negative regulatory protein RseA
MTDEQRSQVSALADGELDGRRAARLYDLAGHDPGLRATWERYHLIGQAIRGERIDARVRGVADAVRTALASEPVASVPRSRRPLRAAALAPFGGVALAAGVVFLAVLAVPVLFLGPDDESWETSDVVPYVSLADASARRWDLDRRELADKLDLFLVNHQEAAPGAGVKGTLPYATLVGYAPVR